MAKKPAGELPGVEFGKRIQWVIDECWRQNILITAVKIKHPIVEPLLILTAKTTEGPKIAFVGAGSLDALGIKAMEQVQNSALVWREDTFALERLGNSEDM
jgi:hypothetical protein